MITILPIFFLFIACAASNTEDNVPSPALKKIIDNKHFQIVSQWANPQYTVATSQLQGLGLTSSNSIGGRMEISGITNYLTIKNDSIIASLPYYGARQMSSGSGSIDQGILIKGAAKIEIEQKGNSYILKFNINDNNVKNEHYTVRLKLNSNLSSIIDITSSHRTNIRYEGRFSKLDTIE